MNGVNELEASMKSFEKDTYYRRDFVTFIFDEDHAENANLSNCGWEV